MLVAPPRLLRIKIVTVAAPDTDHFIRCYIDGLGYDLREQGTVDAALSQSWGADAARGQRYALLSSDTAPDVFVRVVESPPVPHYRPLQTFGWNSFEIIVDDVHAVRRRLSQGPFQIIGEPRPLGFRPTIHAMQVIGPGNEVLYLTTETGDRSTSPLPSPSSLIGRPFIVVLGAPDIVAARDFYAGTFDLLANPIRASRGQTVQRAWGGTEDGTHPITLVRFREHGNSIELNGYIKPGLGKRPCASGDLPPGNAIASFSVPSLDDLRLPYLRPPAAHASLAYGGARAACFIGPAGELVELVEEPDRDG